MPEPTLSNFEDVLATTTSLYLGINKEDVIDVVYDDTPRTENVSGIDPATILLILQIISQIIALYIERCPNKSRLVNGARESSRIERLILGVGLRKAYFDVKETITDCPRIDIQKLSLALSNTAFTLGEVKVAQAIKELE